jgi:hypothetical protein
MAFGFKEYLGQAANAANGSTLTINTLKAAASGDAIVIALYGDNEIGKTPTVTGPVSGDVFVRVDDRTVHTSFGNQDLMTAALFVCYSSAGFASGSNLVIHHNGGTNERLALAFTAEGLLEHDAEHSNAGVSQAVNSGLAHIEEAVEFAVGIVGYDGQDPIFGGTGHVVNGQVQGEGATWTTLAKVQLGYKTLLVSYRLTNYTAPNVGYDYRVDLDRSAWWLALINTFIGVREPALIQDAERVDITETVRVRYGNRTIRVHEDIDVGDAVGADGGDVVVGAPRTVRVHEDVAVGERIVVRDQGVTNYVRLGSAVPIGAVNLAWLQIPLLLPQENLSLVDTARFIAENDDLVWREALPTGAGYLDPVDGFRHRTYYNSSTSASGQVGEGPAQYELTRPPDISGAAPQWNLEYFTSRIRVLHPRAVEPGDAWYPQVQDGVVIRRHILQEGDRSWLSQVFSPGDELVLTYTVVEAHYQPRLDDDRTVETRRQVTDFDRRTLTLPDLHLQQLSSLTVNGQELLSGDLTRGDALPFGPVEAWDPENGTITLSRSLDSASEIFATYQYQEFLLPYHGFWDETAQTYRDLDLNPEPGHTFDGGRDTAELLNRALFLYLVPASAYRLRKKNGDGTYSVEPDRVIYSGTRFTQSFLRWELGGTLEEQDTDGGGGGGGGGGGDDEHTCRKRSTFGYTTFARAYFVDDVPLDPGLPPTTPTGTSGGGIADMPSALLLAKIYVTPAAQVENVEVIDTRVRGGGIPVSVNTSDSRLPGETRRQAETYWDIGGWDGSPVPLAGVLLIDLPQGVRTGAAPYTQFSESEIMEIAQRHVAAGVKVLVRYLD